MSPARQACAFAVLFTKTEMTLILTRPWTRTAGVLHWLLTGLVTVNLALFLPWPYPGIAIAASLALALTLTTALVGLLLLLGERAGFLRATHRWYIRDDKGERGAYLRRDRHTRRLTVCSVTAAPRGRGLGEQLLTTVLADIGQEPLQLWAVNSRVAGWYRRHGFTAQRRGLRGIFMTRPANQTGPPR